MTVSTTSTSSNIDFNLDNFPPPRPSFAATRVIATARRLSSPSDESSYSSSDHSRSLQMPAPSSSKSYGLPSNPRSPRILEAGVRRFAAPRPRSGLRAALSGIFMRQPESELDIPIQDRTPRNANSHRNAWPPLRVEKQYNPHTGSCRCANPKRRKRRYLCIALLCIVILYLLVDTIVLNVRVFSPQLSKGGSQYGTNDNSYTLSAAQELCLTQFTVNAPANASFYPCSTCLSLLQDIPASFEFSTSDGNQTLSNSLQFCGLQSLVVGSGAAAQSALINGGWVQDVDFCTWTGVQCDGEGRVDSL